MKRQYVEDVDPRLIHQIGALLACCLHPPLLKSVEPSHFLNAEIGAAIAEMQAFKRGDAKSCERLEQLLATWHVHKNGNETARAFIEQVTTDWRYEQLQKVLRESAFDLRVPPHDKAAFIDSVKKAIGDV